MLEVGIVIAVFFLVLEIAWRVWKRVTSGKFLLLQEKQPVRKAEVFRSHPYSLYCKRPNARGLYPSNNLGYAGVRDYTVERKENTVRIMVLGGSTVEDHALEVGPESSWPAVLEDILNESFPGTRVEVINCGLAGYCTVESIVDFMLNGVELRPDILLVYHNINDVLTIQMTDGFKPDYSHVRQAKSWKLPWVNRLPQFRISFVYEYLRHLVIARFGAANTILERISSPPWVSAESFDEDRVRVFGRNVANLVALAQANGCRPVLIKWECPWETEGNYPWGQLMQGDPEAMGTKYFRYIRANNEALRDVANSVAGCGYMDVGPFEQRLFRPDNLHFTGEGLREMAGRVADGVAPLVREVIDQSPAKAEKR